jgi:excisionase family DNA binding protein
MSTFSIYKVAQTGKIPANKVSRQWKVKKEEIDAWVEKRKVIRKRDKK